MPRGEGFLGRSRLGRALAEILHGHTLAALGFLLLGGAGLLLWHEYRLHSALMKSVALETAGEYSRAIAEFRTLYTSEVVERARSAGLEVTHDYTERPGAIPLPATLSIELGNRMGRSGPGGKTSLYSAYPFPWRNETGGLRDDFQRRAWGALSQDPETPFYEFTRLDGLDCLRYATADRMRPSCVGCHNSHPASPKRDWSPGDLRGVLEVMVPLGRATALTHASIRESTALLAGSGIFSLCVLGVVVGTLRRNASEAQRLTEAKERANAELRAEIGERTRAETALATHVEELARRNQELDEFNTIASHDLQEPLRKLVSFSALLREDVGRELPPEAEGDLRFIQDAAGRMQRLVRDLLAYSRTGTAAIRRERIPLDDCADQAIDSLAMRLRDSGAQIVRGALPVVWGDPTLLTQLYQNLIANALKFTGPDPPEVRLTAVEETGEWVFGVEDNGIGIPTEYTQQVFEPFRRLHGPREYEGTGIGLAICRKTVERHGGRIWVEPRPGGGSRFRFTLDGDPAPAPGRRERQDRAPDQAAARVAGGGSAKRRQVTGESS